MKVERSESLVRTPADVSQRPIQRRWGERLLTTSTVSVVASRERLAGRFKTIHRADVFLFGSDVGSVQWGGALLYP
ncbi:hypothetical protein [Microbacterium enclense]|uniref:hypothetical protein n=1 Tax=Microbacterium enclense TaxID=993073 RepID=UPI000B0476D4|nr:hypothetical protein [Microbacterium enclense]